MLICNYNGHPCDQKYFQITGKVCLCLDETWARNKCYAKKIPDPVSYTKTPITHDILRKLCWIDRFLFPNDFDVYLPPILKELKPDWSEIDIVVYTTALKQTYRHHCGDCITKLYQEALAGKDSKFDCEVILRLIATF